MASSETDSQEYVDAVDYIMAAFEDENDENSDPRALELADEVFTTCRSSGASVAAIKTTTVQSGSDGVTGQVSSPTPATDPDQGGTLAEQIAALQKQMKNFRGSQSGKGIQRQNTGGRGGGRSGHGGAHFHERFSQVQGSEALGWPPQHSVHAALDVGILELLLLGSSELPLERSHREEATIGQWQAQHFNFLTCF